MNFTKNKRSSTKSRFRLKTWFYIQLAVGVARAKAPEILTNESDKIDLIVISLVVAPSLSVISSVTRCCSAINLSCLELFSDWSRSMVILKLKKIVNL